MPIGLLKFRKIQLSWKIQGGFWQDCLCHNENFIMMIHESATALANKHGWLVKYNEIRNVHVPLGKEDKFADTLLCLTFRTTF